MFSAAQKEALATTLLAAAVAILLWLCVTPAQAQEVPRSARQYRAELVRNARLVWGIDAPVATFAAQVHQESAWRPDAVSRVGAKGLAQFMPATATWISSLEPALADNAPYNPTWALRALVQYDRWLWDRLPGMDDCNRMHAVLRSYNGGLGHWQAEARIAGARDRDTVATACGKARRHISFCPENLGYPQRILGKLQPLYMNWGPGVCS